MKKVSNLKTAATYADALYNGAVIDGCLPETYKDILYLKKLPTETLDQLQKIDNPLLKEKAKDEIIKSVAQHLNISKTTTNMLKLLAQRNKIFLLPKVAEHFVLLYQQKHNIAEVQVITSLPLTKEQDQRLREKLNNIFHKEIILEYIIDTNIIGGLVLRYGTYLIDVSVRNKLNSLEQVMKGTK